MAPAATREQTIHILRGVGITLAIFAAAAWIPLLGFGATIALPLPTAFYRLRLGRRIGALVPALALFVIGLIAGELGVDVFYFGELLLLGFVLAELLEFGLRVEPVVAGTAGAVLLSGLAMVLVYSGWAQQSVTALVGAYVDQNLQLTLALYERMGVGNGRLEVLEESIGQIRYVLVRILPGLAAASTLFVVWTNLLLLRGWLRRRQIPFPDVEPLNRWKAPDVLVWAVIGSGGLLLLPLPGLKLVGFNVLIVLMMPYFFQGVAIMAFFFEKKKVPRGARIFAYTLISVQQLLLLLVIGMGFFDMWLNFRRLPGAPSSDSNPSE